ncbi:MAG: cytidylate kinase-like family protein [Clostridia bacterium]|nr:cytidylate kinase-like family protein [Clostridia bacterium]
MKKIITISREFGSGGRSIGKEVANRLGYKYYDKELVKHVAAETGFAPQYIEEQGEYAPGKHKFAYAFTAPGTPGIMDGLSASDFLWNIQRRVILKLADEEPCVIVGRCADYILKDREDCLNIFVHADKQYRAERIVRLYGESEKKPVKRLDEKDKKRKVNYEHYAGREWGNPRNYHLCLDSGLLGQDVCVETIIALATRED